MSNKTESFIYFEIFLQILLKRTTQALFLPILVPFTNSNQRRFVCHIFCFNDGGHLHCFVVHRTVKKKNTQEPELHYLVSNHFN